MTIPQINETFIRNLATANSFRRGTNYYEGRAVVDVIQRGNVIQASVEGNNYEPYQITLSFSESNLLVADCTCPYDFGGYCKHIVATLLTIMHNKESIEMRPTVTELLTDLKPEQLVDLLTKLLTENPHLLNQAEIYLNASKNLSSPDTTYKRHTPIDISNYRRKTNYIMNSSHDYWATAGAASQMRELFEQANPFIQAGDGHNALSILEAITEVFVDRWHEFDDSDGEMSLLFGDLGVLFAEAILNTDLSTTEREKWANKFTRWQNDIEDYGVEDGFDISMAAANLGWDYEPLQAVLTGKNTEGIWGKDRPWHGENLIYVWLAVLEREKRFTEYLNLAKVEGILHLYLTMLAKLDRADEAINYARNHVTDPNQILVLAKVLREKGLIEQALEIAEYGLSLSKDTPPNVNTEINAMLSHSSVFVNRGIFNLAHWLRDFASAVNQPALALKAAKLTFSKMPSLENYQAVKNIAGTEWETIKPTLLAKVSELTLASTKIEIYLAENMLVEAMNVIDEEKYVSYYTLEPVVDAVWETHPLWVIPKCKAEAEVIMDAAKSKHYHHAIKWLEKVKNAYQIANKTDEWHEYINGLINQHTRKYSLRPQLEDLR